MRATGNPQFFASVSSISLWSSSSGQLASQRHRANTCPQGPQGGQWADFLWGLLIGTELSLASYTFGLHCALAVDRFLLPRGKQETAPLDPQNRPAVHALEQAEQHRERDDAREAGKEGPAARLVDQVS